MTDKYIIDVDKVAGWANFQKHCYDVFQRTNIVNIVAVYNHELAQLFGFDFPAVRVITPRTYPAYLRFRTEAEYTAFALKWA